MSPTPLLDPIPTPRGSTFSPTRDGKRLNAQARRVFEVMSDGQWRGLRDIAALTHDPEASISARLRDLRRIECSNCDGNGQRHDLVNPYGPCECCNGTGRMFTVERRYIRRGLWVYRVVA